MLEALLYVTDSGTDTIVERTTYEPLDSVTVGVDPFAMVVGPSGLRAYVTISGSDTVSVIDTLTRTVATTIGVGDRPADVAIRPNTFQIYGANQGGDSVINRITDTVTATVTGLSAPPRWPSAPTAAACTRPTAAATHSLSSTLPATTSPPPFKESSRIIFHLSQAPARLRY